MQQQAEDVPSVESFETKRGVARFTDSAVHFDESLLGYVHSLYEDYWQSEVWWLKVMFVGYIAALLYALWWGITAVRGRDVFLLAAVVGLLGALWLLNYVRGFRPPNRISLEAIEAVAATRGSKGLTRPRLIVHYSDDSSIYKRRVNLPSLHRAWRRDLRAGLQSVRGARLRVGEAVTVANGGSPSTTHVTDCTDPTASAPLPESAATRDNHKRYPRVFPLPVAVSGHR